MDNTKNTGNTEDQILEAAREVFIEKGMDGARMQEIADRAGINKALLHYYFRSKEKLFFTIFKKLIHTLFKQVNQNLKDEDDLFKFIDRFVHSYISLLSKNQYLPNFILNEINRNHENFVQIIETSELDKSRLEKLVNKSIAEGKIIPITLENLMVDILAMCIFPIAGRPIILNYLFQGDKKAYGQFMDQRAEHIIHLMKLALTPTDQTKK